MQKYKQYEIDIIYYWKEGRFMHKNEKILSDRNSEDDLGFILQQLEELQNFYPVYKTMIKKE